MKKIFISIIFIFFILHCYDTEHILRVGTNVWPGYEPLYVAQDLNKWEKDKIKLVEYPSASEVMRAFRNRAIEGASLTMDEVLMLKQDNIPVKIVLIHDISNGADAILAKKEIQNIKDLRGKKVGVESDALGAFVLTRALELHGLKISDIKIIHRDANEHEHALISGEVDAVVTFEPTRTKLLTAGAHEIFTSREIKNEIVDVLVFHESALSSNNEEIQKLTDAWFWAVDMLKNNPDKTAGIISRRLKITPREVLESYNGLEIPGRDANISLLQGENSELVKNMKNLNRILLQNKLIDSEYNVSDIFTSEFIKK